MSLQFSASVRDGQNDSIETNIGASPKMRLLSGSPPINCAAVQTGTLLCEMDLPADYMAASSGGTKSKSGTWEDAGITAGTVGYFRIVNNAGSVCHVQGTVTAAGGGGDATMDNTSVAAAQVVTVNTFSFTAGNA